MNEKQIKYDQIRDTAKAIREEQIQNEDTTLGIIAIALGLFSFVFYALSVIGIFAGLAGVKTGSKFETKTGHKSKQLRLSLLGLFLSIFSFGIYFIISIINLPPLR